MKKKFTIGWFIAGNLFTCKNIFINMIKEAVLTSANFSKRATFLLRKFRFPQS